MVASKANLIDKTNSHLTITNKKEMKGGSILLESKNIESSFYTNNLTNSCKSFQSKEQALALWAGEDITYADYWKVMELLKYLSHLSCYM
jgi:biopolymer transport protein ExbD